MKTGSKQRGFLTIKNLIIVLMFGFFLTCGFKILPAYFDNRFIVAALKSVGESDPPLHERSASEIKSALQSTLTLNNIRGDVLKNIEVVRDKGKVFVNIDYEVRQNLFSNLDVVMVFENQLDSSRPDLCCERLHTVSKKK